MINLYILIVNLNRSINFSVVMVSRLKVKICSANISLTIFSDLTKLLINLISIFFNNPLLFFLIEDLINYLYQFWHNKNFYSFMYFNSLYIRLFILVIQIFYLSVFSLVFLIVWMNILMGKIEYKMFLKILNSLIFIFYTSRI